MSSKQQKQHTEGNNPLTDTGRIRLKEMNRSNNVRSYLYAIVSIFIIGTLGAGMILYLRPESDPVIVVPLAFALAGSTIFTLSGFIKSLESNKAIEEVKVLTMETKHTMNSGLTEMLQLIKAGAHAEGVLDGQIAAEKRADKITAERVAERKAAKKK